MLLLDFRELHDAGDVLPIQGAVDIPRIAAENQQVIRLAPIACDLMAIGTAGICRVRGHLETLLRYECSRCLEEYDSPLVANFDEQFSERVRQDDVHLVEGSQVDLTPYIEEVVNLVIDFRPLCRDDCQGLCSVCGTNLNDHRCNCDRAVQDPRWAALEGLLSKDEPE
ncbi:YceD family protein [Alicyclobacillus sp. ALC3]|uniref:YceD family protein n=1 Tax=Alicyclobacillus sp. ALC3 TaxID=2796143 RepID=UPI002378957D|nr:DUF177 domain-containing protein [Alicyclobacillus sp. ALC3]WDL97396.1 DUF177 domain-containing protein [Alicyclobacillus sp. ALC3]